LPNAHPLEDIHVSLEDRIGFVCERSRYDLCNIGFARCIREQSRIYAVAGNDAESV
jgi:hypothetical protein